MRQHLGIPVAVQIGRLFELLAYLFDDPDVFLAFLFVCPLGRGDRVFVRLARLVVARVGFSIRGLAFLVRAPGGLEDPGYAALVSSRDVDVGRRSITVRRPVVTGIGRSRADGAGHLHDGSAVILQPVFVPATHEVQAFGPASPVFVQHGQKIGPRGLVLALLLFVERRTDDLVVLGQGVLVRFAGVRVRLQPSGFRPICGLQRLCGLAVIGAGFLERSVQIGPERLGHAGQGDVARFFERRPNRLVRCARLLDGGIVFGPDFFEAVFRAVFRLRIGGHSGAPARLAGLAAFLAGAFPVVEARRAGPADPLLFDVRTGQELRIAAQQDVGSAAGHVRGDRDRAAASGLGNDVGLGLVVHRVQHVVLDLAPLEQAAQVFGLLHRHGADQHGLAALVTIDDVLDRGVEFLALRLVHHVGVIDADHRAVGRNHDDVQVVDLLEFDRFGVRSAGHAAQLVVHAEVVLNRDRRQRLVLFPDAHALFRLDRLMQAVGPAPARHQAAGEFVHDDDFPVLHHVVHVTLEDGVGLQRLVDVVQAADLGRVVQVAHAQDALDLGHAVFGQGRGLQLFVDRVIGFTLQPRNDAVDRVVFFGGFLGRSGDDERGACFVDQDVVHLVDDGEIQFSLRIFFEGKLHVVAQVIESVFVIRAVRDVRGVRLLAADRSQIHEPVILHHVRRIEDVARVVRDRGNRQPQAVIDRPHPLHVAPRQIVVDGHQMRAAAGQRIQVQRQGGHQRLPLPRLHLRDTALVQYDAAQQLAIVMPHAGDPPRYLAHDRVGFGQQFVEHFGFRGTQRLFQPLLFLLQIVAPLDVVRVAGRLLGQLAGLSFRFGKLLARVRGRLTDSCPKPVGLRAQFLGTHVLQRRLATADLLDQRLQAFENPLIFTAEDLACEVCQHGRHSMGIALRPAWDGASGRGHRDRASAHSIASRTAAS